MKPTQTPNCRTCRHLLCLEVAGDDERKFCSSEATKLLPAPIGYITTGEEAQFCGSYQEGTPKAASAIGQGTDQLQHGAAAGFRRVGN